jgi:lymphocyte antigen 6 complex locus protein D/E/F/G6/H
MERSCLSLLVLLSFVSLGAALECYTCTVQDNNKEKCVKTTKQCEQYQDCCVTEVRWAIPPYWTPDGHRIHYISKNCDTSQNCANRKQAAQSGCVRDWWLDWYCVECCQGDMCNYYVTMGSSRLRGSLLFLLLTTTAVVRLIYRS